MTTETTIEITACGCDSSCCEDGDLEDGCCDETCCAAANEETPALACR